MNELLENSLFWVDVKMLAKEVYYNVIPTIDSINIKVQKSALKYIASGYISHVMKLQRKRTKIRYSTSVRRKMNVIRKGLKKIAVFVFLKKFW